MPREGPSSDDVPPPPEPLLESKGPGWIQVSVRCLVCEKKFKVWVPDTPQNEMDASDTVMTRLKQHLWSVYESPEHGLEASQIKNMLKSVQVDIQEHADDKPLAAKIIRKRKAVEQPTDSMEDQAQPQPLITMSRWPGSRSSPSVPFVTGSEGMNLEKQD